MPKQEPYVLVYFDFETTGLKPAIHEIIEIGASCRTTLKSSHFLRKFNVHILPKQQVSPGAQKVNGLSVKSKISRNGTSQKYLYKNGKGRLETVGRKAAFKSFLNYLKKIKRHTGGARLFLVGHNAHNFDCSFLFRALEKIRGGIEALLENVDGIIDTIVVFREIYPGLKGFTPYSQPNLIRTFLEQNPDAHSAMADIRGLRKLVKAKLTEKQLIKYGYEDTEELYSQK